MPQVHFSLKFSENTPIFDALGGVLVDAQEFHQKSFPLAKSIQRCVQLLTQNTDENLSIFTFTRSNACFYAHESTSKYYRLTDRIVTNGKFCFFYVQLKSSFKKLLGSLGNFFESFKDQGYISKLAIDMKQLEIRIVCEEDRLVSSL